MAQKKIAAHVHSHGPCRTQETATAHVARRKLSTTCFKCFRQMFHLDVAKVDLGCCICCNDNIRMLQSVCFECFSYVSSV